MELPNDALAEGLHERRAVLEAARRAGRAPLRREHSTTPSMSGTLGPKRVSAHLEADAAKTTSESAKPSWANSKRKEGFRTRLASTFRTDFY